jgi:hypothetical protein
MRLIRKDRTLVVIFAVLGLMTSAARCSTR